MDSAAIATLGTIMGVWAHPDDETWTSAGLMAVAASNGQRVVIVTATHGELGSVDPVRWPLNRLGAIRAKELLAALTVLGISEHHWLDYQDGDCENVDATEACTKLEAIFDAVRPDTVLTFGSDGLTGHPDHKTVGTWAKTVAARCQPQPAVYEVVESLERYDTIGKHADKLLNIYFNTTRPRLYPEAQLDLCCKLPDDVLSTKIAALKAHTSQTEKLMSYLADGTLSPAFFTPECFMRASA